MIGLIGPIGLIGNPTYSPHHRVRERVPLRCVRVRFWAELEAVRKGLRIRMGRYPAEIAEGAEVYWEGEKGPTSEPFSTTALVN